MALFPDATAFLVFCEAHDFHHFSPFSLSLSSSPPLSPLRFSFPSSSVVSVVVVSSLSCVVVVFFSVLCCHCFCCCCRVAAGRCRCSCCCSWCCWWVLRVRELLFLVFSFFLLISLSFKPLLRGCQVHSARRVACT